MYDGDCNDNDCYLIIAFNWLTIIHMLAFMPIIREEEWPTCHVVLHLRQAESFQ